MLDHVVGADETHFTSSSGARSFYEAHGYVSAGEPLKKFGILRGYPYHKVLHP